MPNNIHVFKENTDLTREEYYTLKDELDKLAYTLRFSIEEELRIYEALLNSVDRQKATRASTDQSTGFRSSETIIDNSTKYRQGGEQNQSDILKQMLGQNETRTTTTTTKRTTRRSGHENDGQQQQIKISRHRNETEIAPELDEKYMQSKLRITRKYKGKFVFSQWSKKRCFFL